MTSPETVPTKDTLKILYDRHGLSLGMTRDGLQAYLSYLPLSGLDKEKDAGAPDVMTEEFIFGLLNEQKITYGLKEDVLKSFIASPLHDQWILIAEGIPPLAGQDARIEYPYKKSQAASPKVLEDGRVDFKDLSLNINVNKGDLLAVKTPCTDGQPGIKVTGEEIPARKGKDKPLIVGRNTVLSEDGLKLIADMDGTVSQVANKISVVEIYTVKGDIDYSTGNIDFVGSVEIMGSVLGGFRVTARGDVLVIGIVEGAEIFAGGNVIIRRGIQGGFKAVIEAGGNIEVKFVNSATLKAGENIQVAGPVMHSRLSAGNKIELIGRNGIGNGGEFQAGQCVEAEVLGSEVGSPTLISVGLDPKQLARFQEVQDELLKTRENLDKVEKAIATLNAIKQSQGSLPMEKEQLLLNSIKARYTLMGQCKQFQTEYAEMQSLMEMARTGQVVVRGTVYPGVTVRMGKLVYKVDHPLKHVTFKREGGEIAAV